VTVSRGRIYKTRAIRSPPKRAFGALFHQRIS
jgi:hypothetical protein